MMTIPKPRLPTAPLLLLGAALALFAACPPGAASNPDAGQGNGQDGGLGDGGADAGEVVIPSPPPVLPELQPAEVLPNPTAPSTEDGGAFGGPAAPELVGVQYVPNRDSALVVLPAVPGAKDYRVFRLPAGASVTTVGDGEQVSGTVLHCAGYRQHNDAWSGARELLQLVEVTGLSGPTALVVEALDRPCPFPGPLSNQHEDLTVTITEVPVEDRITFSLYTEAEVRARFGSLVRNGHGPGAGLAQPGPTAPPRVLARTTVRLSPLDRATAPTSDFFDDFDGTSGPVVARGASEDSNRCYRDGRQFSNERWDFFTWNDHLQKASFAEERGVMRVTLPDWEQDVFASWVGVPRKPAQLSDTQYLHLTFEVASNATARRYWWVGLCGAAEPGATFDAQGHFTGHLVQTPFFYQPDGYNVSVEGWNCLQFFPRDGSPFPLGPDDVRTQADLRVMVNTPGDPKRDNVVNVSPAQYGPNQARPSWFLQQDAQGVLGAPMLDDQLLVAPRTRFDAYVRRDRLVLYVNGEQRLCNDFPTHRLTMAEAAVAVGQVLYHSAAERVEFSRSYNDRTGQRFYLENLPYVDEREWDNVGFQSGVNAPADFDATRCYLSP